MTFYKLSRYAALASTPHPGGFIYLELDGWTLGVGEMLLGLAFLPSEKDESQTLARALILSLNAHNESSYLSPHHGRIQECK